MKKTILFLIFLFLVACTNGQVRENQQLLLFKEGDYGLLTPSEIQLAFSSEKFKLATPSEEPVLLTPSEAQALETPSEVDPSSIDLSLKPNEAGKIMVLMYHNVGEKESGWIRSKENLKKDLSTLYEKGYRPLSLKNYVSGQIDTPAGYTPVVITVDDAQSNNFYYLENGEIDPDCFVGILLNFNKEHPDFPLHVTFFATGPYPFGQEGFEKEKIKFLIDKGMDVGNHTHDHRHFNQLTATELQTSIGSQAAFLQSLAPEGYEINMLALPYGSRPEDKSLDVFLQKGEHQGHSYENIAILNVGWDPWFSPFHKDFSPYTIHRITASEINVDGVGLYDWLNYFDKNPHERFISDGNPTIVTLPSTLEDQVKLQEGLLLNTYTP